MLAELEPHLDKIMLRFRDAELTVSQTASAASLRGAVVFKQRTLQSVSNMLRQVNEDTVGPVAALIRLHYVRAGRAVDVDFKLVNMDELRVGSLIRQVHHGLAAALNSTYRDLQLSFKRMTVNSVVETMAPTAATEPLAQSLGIVHRRRQLGLEQYARTLVRNVAEQAEGQGRLSASTPNDYGIQHA